MKLQNVSPKNVDLLIDVAMRGLAHEYLRRVIKEVEKTKERLAAYRAQDFYTPGVERDLAELQAMLRAAPVVFASVVPHVRQREKESKQWEFSAPGPKSRS